MEFAVLPQCCVHIFSGSNATARSSFSLMAQPVTQRTRRRLVDIAWK
ncbi:hypothetical protein N566_01725 [Streptomycetaceae bacterium MP113-05]|nr:hypothetical protein N566_01725 [Streptomycetaceae bacterium MP113-05]